MGARDIDSLISRIIHMMYGHNFQVTLGIDIFNGVTEPDFQKAIKEKYPETHPDLHPLVAVEKQGLIENIKECLNYRGDSAAGLILKKEEEVELNALQEQYINYLEGFMEVQAKCFYYPDTDGLPGYPVFWDYCYVLFADHARIVLIYGSSSD